MQFPRLPNCQSKHFLILGSNISKAFSTFSFFRSLNDMILVGVNQSDHMTMKMELEEENLLLVYERNFIPSSCAKMFSIYFFLFLACCCESVSRLILSDLS